MARGETSTVFSFFASCPRCLFLPRRMGEKPREEGIPDERSVHKFSSIAISLLGRGSRVIVPIKGLSGGAYFSFVYTGVYR